MLSEASGVSGYESPVRDVIVQELEPLVDEITTDRLGNVIALKRGQGDEPRPRVLVAAHMDEIGLMVLQIEKGFIRFVTVGGFDPRVLVGQQVIVHGRQALPGVIGNRPPHVVPREERDKPIPIDNLFIDVGLDDAQVRELVQVGDIVTLVQPFVEFRGNKLASGKALDNRTSVAALILAFEMLNGLRHDWDVYGVATAQEEVGLRGAITSAYGVAPQIGLAVDVTQGDMPGVPEVQTMKVDGGPAIGLGPNFAPALFDRVVKTAQAHEIPHQIEPAPWVGGTDAVAIQVAREGIPTSLLSIPLRYMHTVVETVALADIERTARLLAHVIAELTDQDWLTSN
ncbi:MAG: M42 family metallopeptidase [Chloroflexi bacterium]|nr:M42 family metallopeptidase [Chloroflexota bacterium]MBU1747939.1 M42 family metallopeptidase [Chloroflexota bacterium]